MHQHALGEPPSHHSACAGGRLKLLLWLVHPLVLVQPMLQPKLMLLLLLLLPPALLLLLLFQLFFGGCHMNTLGFDREFSIVKYAGRLAL